MNSVRNGLMELKSGKDATQQGGHTKYWRDMRSYYRMLDYVLMNVDLTIEKRATSLETISNRTTQKTHATSSVHKAHKKVVHDNNGDEE